MRLTVPAVKGVDSKTLRGFIGQLAHPSEGRCHVDGEWSQHRQAALRFRRRQTDFG